MPKQSELPGTERPVIQEIEEAAEHYVGVRDKRMALTEKEVAAKINLLQAVTAHSKELNKDGDGNLCYRYDDVIVLLKPGKANVKVKTVHEAEDEEEED